MTLEELLESSPEALEAMSQKELEDFFAPMLDITRPERPSAIYKDGDRNKSKKLSKLDQLTLGMDASQKDKMNGILKEMDLDLEELL